MAIKKIKIKNFKSFGEEEINLGNFNVLIGANASGKSNFIQIFKFLRDIADHGLDNAIQMQGGVEYLRNINIGSSENLSISIDSGKKVEEVELGFEKEKEKIGVKLNEVNYEFALKFRGREPKFKIVSEKLTQKCEFFRRREMNGRKERKEKIGDGEILISLTNGKLSTDLNKPENVPIEKEDITLPKMEKIPINNLLLETPFLFIPAAIPLKRSLGNISIYDFDPKLSKEATKITGKADLEENGNNLSIVLNNLIKDKDKKRKLFNLVKDTLPFIDDLDVKKFEDKSLLFKLKETYSKKEYLPASLISDGTINITALIIALYFEKKQLTIIEEPERNIHPYLISRVVNMMKDASQDKQIIVTTHNPEILKHCKIEDILLVSRNKEGFSKISRPMYKEEVKTFLKNEIGIDELYVQKLLEI